MKDKTKARLEAIAVDESEDEATRQWALDVLDGKVDLNGDPVKAGATTPPRHPIFGPVREPTVEPEPTGPPKADGGERGTEPTRSTGETFRGMLLDGRAPLPPHLRHMPGR